MTDLISRADAIEELTKLPTDTIHSHFDDGYSLGIKHAIRIITTLPSADAVPNCHKCAIKQLWKETEKEDLVAVVRCKDCCHGWYDDDIEYYICRHPKGLNEELYGVDFCSYGKRREP